jgi:hypothetical protein
LKKELNHATFAVSQDDELDIWYDDEFLLKGDPLPTLIIKNSKEPKLTDYDIFLCGNIMFASHDKEGDTVSLTDKAKQKLKRLKQAKLGEYPVWILLNF